MAYNIYSKENLEPIIRCNISWSGVIQALGLRQAGGTQENLRKRAKAFSISTSHFLGQAHNRGKTGVGKAYTKETLLQKVLVKGKAHHGTHLLRSLIRLGIKKRECEKCHHTQWMEQDIPLEIHHLDEDHENNELSNLEVLCPNCHALYGPVKTRRKAMI